MVKKKGTREEVYLGLAERTSGYMTKEDIIVKKTPRKTKYLSRKISERMKIRKKSFKFPRRKEQLHTRSNNLKIKFNENQNICQEYYYDNHQNESESESDSESESKRDFTIEELDNIDFDNLNLNDL